MTYRSIGRISFGIALILGVAAILLVWRPKLPAAATVQSQPNATLVVRGYQLAQLGNCANCHSDDGGAALAGGRPLDTPFGVIHATNITPDHSTGIGSWSEEAFKRSMREGVDREGRHLYPAFPYNHFALMSDADIAALYAYLRTITPEQNEVLDLYEQRYYLAI